MSTTSLFRIKLQDGSIVPTDRNVLSRCCKTIKELDETLEGFADTYPITDVHTIITPKAVEKMMEFANYFNRNFEEDHAKMEKDEKLKANKEFLTVREESMQDKDEMYKQSVKKTEEIYKRKITMEWFCDNCEFYKNFLDSLVRSDSEVESVFQDGSVPIEVTLDNMTLPEGENGEVTTDAGEILRIQKLRYKYKLMDELMNLAAYFDFCWMKWFVGLKVSKEGEGKGYYRFTEMFEFEPGCLPSKDEIDRMERENRWLYQVLAQSPAKDT